MKTTTAKTSRVTSSPEIEHYPWSDNAPGLMRHLDVLVLPSYEEPFGTVLAEAMAVGTPVVATRVDGLPEVVDDGVTGHLVRYDETDPAAFERALAEAIDTVLADPAAARRMGEAGRERAVREFGWDAIARRTVAVYEEILRK